MAKGLVFKLRMDEADRLRLDKLSEHYAAPAATVVRMLIKNKADWLESEGRIHGPVMPKKKRAKR
jgi:predicted DNA-binding protein